MLFMVAIALVSLKTVKTSSNVRMPYLVSALT